jgi:K+-sensing histidine kinase KdpD
MRMPGTLRDWARLIDVRPNRALDFGVAFALVATATMVNLLAWPIGSDEDGHYFALVAAVLLSGLYGGFGPGLFATALAGLSSAYFALSPQFSISVSDANAARRLGVFLVEGALLSLASHVVRNQHTMEIPRVGLRRYLAIPLATGAATVAKLIVPDLAREMPFAFNYAAICICSWTGGIVFGMVATGLLAGLTRYLFLEPVHSLSVANQAEATRVGVFVAEGLLLAVLGDSNVKLKRLAANASGRARTYITAALNKEVNAVAIRAISRDTVWEWGLDTGEINRTPSWQDTISVALPMRETYASWVERMHPDDRNATVTRLRHAIEEGQEELQYTYRLLAPSGEFLSVWDHAFIVRGADWKPMRVIGRSAELPSSRRLQS